MKKNHESYPEFMNIKLVFCVKTADHGCMMLEMYWNHANMYPAGSFCTVECWQLDSGAGHLF
jgi:hypothetical protein